MQAEFQDIYELTPLQEAMVVQSVFAPDSAVYNIPVELEVRGELDQDAFEAAWRKLVERHDVLRTSFVWEDLERPYQVVHRSADFALTRHDWRKLTPDERAARLKAYAEAERGRVFTLTQAPLVRASLLRVADDVYRFVFTAHHAVLEGWSIGILLREAGRLYESLVRGTEAELPPAPRFASYIGWLREQDNTAAEAYWRETLERLTAPRLPVDHPDVDVRALAQTNDTCTVALPRSLSDDLRAWARAQRLTQSTVFQGLWALLLSRYTASADVVFGSAVSGRPVDLPGAEETVGLFVNTLPVRAAVREDDRLVPWLQSLQRHQATAREYEFASLRQVQAWSGAPSGVPLFDNVVVFQNWAGGFDRGEWGPGLTVQFLRAPGGSDQPITLNVVPAPETRLTLLYNPNLFEAATVENMLDQYRTLLEELAAGADRPLSSLGMLSTAERDRVVVDWNDTSTPYPHDATVHGLFEAQAAQTPDAIAVEFAGETLTSDALNRRANQVAHHLIDLGVGPEVKVGIAVERSAEMVVGILGVLKAGGAYVPLDPGYPAERLSFMMQDTRAPVVLTQAHLEANLPAHDGTVLRLDADRPRFAAEPDTNPTSATTATSLAYVMYTSGSTGRPKGACIPHRSVIRLVRNTNYLTVDASDVVLQFAPISFDASTLELWGSLLNGAKLVVSGPRASSLEELGRAIESHGITTLWLTGALFQQMVNEQPGALAGVRQLLAGGDALSVPHVRRMIDRLSPGHRLINGYGPTENTTFTCCHVMNLDSVFARSVPIGRPISNTTAYLLDANLEPVPVGVPGELYTGGDGLARGYLNDPALTAARFVPNPFGEAGSRLYRTGDRARYGADGTIEFLGRVDFQMKVRGFRIEPGEIETALLDTEDVREAIVLSHADASGTKQLVAYLVTAADHARSRSALRERLAERLPAHMVPSAIVFLDAMPLSPNGKVDRAALPAPSTQRQAESVFVEPRSDIESRLAAIWRDVLDVAAVGVNDNFFDLGGHSLQLIQMHQRLERELEVELPILELFRHTTISAIAARIGGGRDAAPQFASVRRRAARRAERGTSSRAVAIVGMSGRFPGADGIAEFWANLRGGVESIDSLTDEQILAAGVSPAIMRRPDYVKAGSYLEAVDRFDAPFFGYTPRQAEIIDPQQRLFLECAWEAIEGAGYDPAQYDGAIGVFAGVTKSSYLDPDTVDPELRRTVGVLQLLMGTDKDYLPTRVSYKLGLSGPSINVQTACSSSLVSAHLAVQSLLNDECDMAIAGGASIRLPQRTGYVYQQDGIASPDGHCRAFDAGANGTVGGNGVALVLLKRLDDALADGDHVIAVIRGSAINNDGADKIGYTAPSVDRQAEAIFAAQTIAEVDPRSIGYVEAHGTGTALGDPIEVEALIRAFRAGTDATGFCAIGSVKTNVGHLDAAAGVTGLIKTALALHHKTVPPSLNFSAPNPKIDFERSPFFVNTEPREWPADGTPRRAGVSSFGIGGTNAHVVLEEAPEVAPSTSAEPWQVLTLSARSADALEQATDEFVAHLRENPAINLADVAFTQHAGRRSFACRRTLTARDVDDAIETLAARDPKRVLDRVHDGARAPVVFMFPGQGAQHPNMGRGLYEQHEVFRAEVERGCKQLTAKLGLDLRDVLFPRAGDEDTAATTLADTRFTQPALFVVEHALARQWMAWGVEPDAMVGHSIGEYVAACLAGVLTFEDALDVVAERGRLMSELPRGAMLAVPVSAAELRERLVDGVSIATVNGPSLTVVAGPNDRIDAFEAALRADGLEPRRLRTSHAFHSAMMDPILEPFSACVAAKTLAAPTLPYLSNLTGTWITADEATDPSYYARHLRSPVRFAACLETLFEDAERVLLEVGPGQTLSALARRHPARPRSQAVAPSMRRAADDVADAAVLGEGMGRLWLAGAPPRWSDVHGGEQRRRVPLPTYPFERQRYWIETMRSAPVARAGRRPDPGAWLNVPAWKPAPLPGGMPDVAGSRWLLLVDAGGLGDALTDHLAERGAAVTRIAPGARYEDRGNGRFVIDPDDHAHYERVLSSFDDAIPDHIVDLWAIGESDEDRVLSRGLFGTIHLVQALAGVGAPEPLEITFVTRGAHAVTGTESLDPAQAAALGPSKVLAQEFPHIAARNIDIDEAAPLSLVSRLVRDLGGGREEPVVAYRGGRRWAQGFETIRADLPPGGERPATLRSRGVYVITGGLGGVGLELARWLAETVQARLVLVSRSGLSNAGADDVTARRRAACVEAIEAAGGEVLVCRADVTDAAAMRQVLAEADQRFGAVHGIIHAAGTAATRTPLRTTDRVACEHVMEPKLRGLAVLAEVLDGRDLDFCIVHSSLSSVMGAAEMVAYVAAHLFMDAFVQQQDRVSATRWMSVNWETWRTWRTEDLTYPAGLAEFLMDRADYGDSLARLFSLDGVTHVIVSTGDVQARIDRWTRRRDVTDAAQSASSAATEHHPRPAMATEYVAPRNETEERLAELWRAVLGIDRVGIYDNLLELGADSVVVIQVGSRATDLGIELTPKQMFAHPTIAELAAMSSVEAVAPVAAAMDARRDAGARKTARPALVPVSRDEPLPLSFSQQRLWFLDQLGAGAAYNVPLSLRLTGTLDAAALQRALDEIVRRHEVLRTSFGTIDGDPVQRVVPNVTCPIAPVDLREAPVAERASRTEAIVREAAERPFELTEAPLLRATLVRTTDDEHVLVIVLHHIVTDGWSMGVLFQELGSLYAAFVRGEPSPLPELALQYADYAAWQRAYLSDDVLEGHVAYWTSQLAGELPVLDLPTDHARPAFQTYAGASQSFYISAVSTETLRKLAQHEGGSLMMVLLAAWQALLGRYSGQDDITIGVPVANRTNQAIENLIGFFVNTLVMRADLSGNPSFRALLRQVSRVALDAFEHQELPFERVVEAIDPHRDLSQNPLYQVVFAMQNAPGGDLALADLEIGGAPLEARHSRSDLEIHVTETPAGLRATLGYSTDLFEPETIGRLVAHFQAFLAGVAQDPDRLIGDVPLLDADERERLLRTFNDTDAPYPDAPAAVHRMFESQAAQTPDAVAIRFGDVHLTYAELNRRANRLAHHLQSIGVGPGERVAILVERSPDMVIGVLGVLKAGAAYVPLDPSYPADRLALMLGDARVVATLTQAALRQALPDDAGTVVSLDEDQATIERAADDDPGVRVDGRDLAYVIYTSGSTGRPKGVAMPHGPLVNLLCWQSSVAVPGAETQTLQFAPFSFDVSFQEIFATLGTGGTLLLIDEAMRRDPAALLAFMRECGVTRIFLPFVALRQLAEVAMEVDAIPSDLREIITAGEALQITPAVRELFRRLPACRLVNQYGPAECHVVSAYALEGDPDEWPALPPIGTPIANTQIYLLDARGRPVPIGVPGELYIGGAAVSRGYLDAPEQSATRFVPDPFGIAPGGRLYRTGDMAHYQPDGNIAFRGRVDHQIKLRGYRVELGEIESVLAAHPAVRQAIVTLITDRAGNDRLVAYTATEDGPEAATASSSTLRAYTKERLPEYMVPTAFVLLDALPLTPSGKVDRRALPAPSPVMLDAFVPPRDGREQLLSEIWSDVLGVERVGVFDDFFELGGHSLLATRLISRMRDVLRVEPPLRALFEHPTVAELAVYLESTTGQDAAPPIVPAQDATGGGDAPLSFSQQRLWFLDRLGAGAAYNMPQALRLTGQIDQDVLERSLATIVARHDALRATFPAVRGVPVQRVASFLDVPLESVDLGHRPESEREMEARRLADAEVETPFDLAKGPLVRAKLIRIAADDHVLLLTSHHIVFDGWSFGVLNRELEHVYAALLSDRSPELPDLPVQYTDYARWQRDWLRDEALERQLGYWREHLSGHSAPLELPVDHPRPPVQTFAGEIEFFAVPPGVTSALRTLGRRHGVTMAITMMAAFKSLLHRYTRRDDVAVGSPIANRRRTEVESLIGFFVNTLVMRTDLSGDPTFTELLGRVKDVALGAYEHQDVPFEQIVDAVQTGRDLSQNPLFQILFAMQNAPRSPFSLPNLTATPFRSDAITARFDLELHIWERPDELGCHFIYNTDLFKRSTIRRLVEHFQNLLEGIVTDPDARLADLPLMDAAERERVVTAWNRTMTSRGQAVCLHHLFEAQVDRTPDAAAVRGGDGVLTYRELDDRANEISHALIARGVGPDARVVICTERSLDMIAGVLGILKAGGAYVPLDPGYPTDRLRYMIVNGDVRLMLGHAATRARLGEVLDDAMTSRGNPPEIIWLDEMTVDAEAATTRPAVEVVPSNLAYVLYTSGSTGRPKGVGMPHAPLVNLMQWQLEHAAVGNGVPTLQFAPLSFDVSCQELFATFISGGELCLVTEAQRRDPELLLRFIDDASVARMFLPFVALRQLIEVAVARDLVPGSLREVITAGEQLQITPDVVEFFRRLPECRLVNQYGPTECHVASSHALTGDPQTWRMLPPIGRPIANTRLYVLDDRQQPVPVGVPGELYIGGTAVARGYLGDPVRTAERFVVDPFVQGDSHRLYRTGDLVRFLEDGNVEFLGRTDDQVKVRGFRIEPGEIETALSEHPRVRQAAVVVREDQPGHARLVAYTVATAASAGDVQSSTTEFRAFLLDRLPAYMVPDAFVLLETLPVTPSGKVDRRALPSPTIERDATDAFVAPRSDLEERIAAVWRDVLDVDRVGVQDNFFDIGGHSLLMVQVQSRLQEELGSDVAGTLSVTDLFQHPTVGALARRLANGTATMSAVVGRRSSRPRFTREDSIAVVGMAGRFPGAPDLETFWRNIRDGVESVHFFSDDELREAGQDESNLRDPHYVKARAVLDAADRFDAWFFGYTPREAELIDPQQRVFLECAHEALERAGYDPRHYAGMIGVWAGASMNTYLANIQSRPELVASAGGFQTLISNDKDFLTTRVSYKLDLRGPSVNVQTACSTSLVAVHEACQALLEGRCDVALAGGVSVTAPLVSGHMYSEGGILSPDGHCRAFDANARGTLVGNGVGVVVLKSLERAIDDGDQIHAVIRGTAVNNDGSNKVGFTAPSVDGQAEVIALAQAAAGVQPNDVTYIEAHGTGTPLGDPIEVAALRKVFEAQTERKGFCGIGSLKTNMGHLDAAAGVGALIKTVLALEHRELPPSLHCETPNPEIDFTNSPFYVVTDRRPWESKDGQPRRAGVSAFGIGGTNAHVIVEEAPSSASSGPARACQLLVLSAKSAQALENATTNLGTHLASNSNAEPVSALADVAYTLQVGRSAFEHRRAVICHTRSEAVAALSGECPDPVWAGHAPAGERHVVFMFPGQGAQYVNMGLGLYRSEPVFREAVDRCLDALVREASLDLRSVLYPDGDDDGDGDPAERLTRTAVAQPALFTVQYALARLWQSWGVEPEACIGHSIGEFTAACVSGVLEVEDALRLVALRGQLMEQMPEGGMLAVPVAERRAKEIIDGDDDLWLSAVNSPSLCVVSGRHEAIDALSRRLAAEDLECRRLHTSHAFHSGLMEDAIAPFVDAVRDVPRSRPRVPYVSNVTGDWITPADLKAPFYWGRHMREPVRFSAGLETVLAHPGRILLEVGPGGVLGALARQNPACGRDRVVVPSLRHVKDDTSDEAFLTSALGRLWVGGADVDWTRYHAGAQRRRVVLPTYPFARDRYWIERRRGSGHDDGKLTKNRDIGRWLYVPVWKPARLADADGAAANGERAWLIFEGATDLVRTVADRVESGVGSAVRVVAGDGFAQLGPLRYTIDPREPGDYRRLLEALAASGRLPSDVVHALSVSGTTARDKIIANGLESVVFLVQALAAHDATARLAILTDGACDVTGADSLRPATAAVLGLARVIPQECPTLACRTIDLPRERKPRALERTAQHVADELVSNATEATVAYRVGRRWVQTYDALEANGRDATSAAPVRDGGVYLITGGLGRVGLEMAEALASAAQVKLVLTGRSVFPAPEAWDRWLDAHDGDDRVARIITRLRAIESHGAEILIARADVADAVAMRGVLARIDERFGALHGVVHAAGVVSGPSMDSIAALTREACEAQLRPKLDGLLVLDKLLGERPLDFRMATSSLSTVLGGLGMGAYAAANACVDAFAAKSVHGEAPWLSVDWDGWQIGDEAESTGQDEARAWGIAHLTMRPHEGADAFMRLLSVQGLPQVAVSTGSLHARLEQWVQRGAGDDDRGETETSALELHARPQLATDYVGARSATERELTDVWQTLLGIDAIGVHDSFFDLGGHSLLATQLLNRLSRTYPSARLSLRTLFDRPTIAGLGEHIDDAGGATDHDGTRTLRERVLAVSPNQRADLLRPYLVEQLAESLGVEAERLEDDTNLADLGSESMIADLIWILKRDLRLTVYAHELRERLSVAALARFVAAELALVAELTAERPGSRAPIVIEPPVVRGPRRVAGPRAGGQAVFVLSAPRSGSTVFRLMLGGHSRLYVPPELSLLQHTGMRQWTESRLALYARDTVVRTFATFLAMEDVESAGALLDDLTRRDAPIAELYEMIQTRADGRTLVDKSPDYAMRRETLERAEELFDRPRYVHLVRHPYAVIESLVRNRMTVLDDAGRADPFGHAERGWAICNGNIVDFLEGVDAERWMQIRYEDLVRDPAAHLQSLCTFLDLDFESAMLNPYGQGRIFAGFGDPDILSHREIEPGLGEVWRKIRLPRHLSEYARALAESYAYELPNEAVLEEAALGARSSVDVDGLSSAEVDELLAKLLRASEAGGNMMDHRKTTEPAGE